MLASLLGLTPEAGQPPTATDEPSTSLEQPDQSTSQASASASGDGVAGRNGSYVVSAPYPCGHVALQSVQSPAS